MFHRSITLVLLALGGLLGSSLWARGPATLAELQPLSPAVLTRAELLVLMPGARMSRTNDKGNTHHWTNEPGGEMVVSSDNRSDGRASTARARWHIDDAGRYCLVVAWKRGEAEDSCRFVLQTREGYFAVNELQPPTQKVHRLGIDR
jgi:hypothetical protein